MKYAEVIVNISQEQLDKTFQYSIPDELLDALEVGSRVIIPFGNSKRSGYIVEFDYRPQIEPDKIKPIIGIDEKSTTIDRQFIKLAYWMKTSYGSTINKALKTVVPVKEKVKADNRKTIELAVSGDEALSIIEECEKHNKPAQARILRALLETDVSEMGFLMKKLSVSQSSIKSLADRGAVRISEYRVFRNEINIKKNNSQKAKLNAEQQKIVDAIIADYDAGRMDTCLIKGVTGSGKTEVYMELIEHVLALGKEVIVLIPEISLTYQTVMRFYNRFGNVVSIINSRLSKGEKYDRFLMAQKGELKVMIGPRSALFTPFSNLGLIVIDEEHENAYQSDQIPRYHARETAIELGRITGAKVVLGSATPSLEAYYKAQNGIYRLYELNNRAGNAMLPQVEIVDLRAELKSGNRRMLSTKLQDYISQRLQNNEQIMLFLNRRGYQGFINCRDCGQVIECPHCAVSLTEHKGNRLKCHYCGYETEKVKICPKCGSKHIGTFKAGTQKVEDEVKELFPNAGILRMDLDTTKGKEGHAHILEKFYNREADILIGTQMIAKGHDFSNVTLVGVLLADTALHSPDYKAAENTFDLLTQVAGRAGRGDKPGNVVIQSYDPDNFSIKAAAKQDYEAFYNEEIEYRRLMGYPPVNSMMVVRIGSPVEQNAINISIKISELESDNVIIIGPSDAPVYKINDVFYRVIYYKSDNRQALVRIKDITEQFISDNANIFKDCQVQFDFR